MWKESLIEFNKPFLLEEHNASLGYVELLDIMPDPRSGHHPDLAVVSAARTSYLSESKGQENDLKLLKYLWVNFHHSPFEMVEFKFRIKTPVVSIIQLLRHRMASVNSQSARYTEVDNTDFYYPSLWRKQAKNNKQASDGFLSADEELKIIQGIIKNDSGIDYGIEVMRDWESLNDALYAHYMSGYNLYKRLVDSGVAKEEARLFLPGYALNMTFIWKIDARNLMNFLRLRNDEHAQYEIRMLAEKIEKIFANAMPNTYDLHKKYKLTIAEQENS